MKSIAKAIVIALSLSASAVSAASFDCTKATTASEKFICQHGKISLLDEQISTSYKAAVKVNPEIKAEMRAWNKTVRDAVIATGSVDAVEAVYNVQIAKLDSVAGAEEKDAVEAPEAVETAPKKEAVIVDDAMIQELTKGDARGDELMQQFKGKTVEEALAGIKQMKAELDKKEESPKDEFDVFGEKSEEELKAEKFNKYLQERKANREKVAGYVNLSMEQHQAISDACYQLERENSPIIDKLEQSSGMRGTTACTYLKVEDEKDRIAGLK